MRLPVALGSRGWVLGFWVQGLGQEIWSDSLGFRVLGVGFTCAARALPQEIRSPATAGLFGAVRGNVGGGWQRSVCDEHVVRSARSTPELLGFGGLLVEERDFCSCMSCLP